MRNKSIILITLVIVVGLTSGCVDISFKTREGTPIELEKPAVVNSPTTTSAPSMAETSTPTQHIPPTNTILPGPSLTSTGMLPLPTETPATIPTEDSAPAVSTEQMVKIFLIAIDDNGRSGELIGCGDSVLPVWVQISPTVEVLKAAFEALLSVKTQYYGESGLYNALYQSDLQLESIALDQGKAQIRLQGTLMLGGECDNPRVEAQLKGTALQFSTVQTVAIYLNGEPLTKVLSLK